MKKIDFHIHTVATVSDHSFVFSMDTLKNYVADMGLECIAITNHNMFDLHQYNEIVKEIPITVFPGIEIDVEGSHLLLIGDGNELEDFSAKCKKIFMAIPTANDSITVEDLEGIFLDLTKYILIPHYQKNPEIKQATLNKLRANVTAGEVTSAKKFKYCIGDDDALVPVCFGDMRMEENRLTFAARHTYIDLGEISFAGIRSCLRDKNKVFLSKEDGHAIFDALANGLKLSTGLNVLLGERSTGKSFTLDKISKQSEFEKTKYIKQFELLEKSSDDDETSFKALLRKKQSLFTEDYLREFKSVVDDLSNINLENDERTLERYVTSLLKNAKDSEKNDAFSKSKLFSESKFTESNLQNLKSIIDAVEKLIENTEYQEIIAGHIPKENLKALAVELMTKYSYEIEINLKKRYLNDIIKNIQDNLKMRTAVHPIEDIDLYAIAKNRMKIEVFEQIVNSITKNKDISVDDIQGYKRVATRRSFNCAQELKSLSGKVVAFSDAFANYDKAYEYLISLRKVGIEESDYYKYFVCIDYCILNAHGYEVSGGERSEFRLLQEISDAQQYDMLLIDEPESSFDNMFLLNKVNKLIKDISKNMPVVIVTHNSTVGASIKPDYILYTSKIIENGEVRFQIYTGYPSDKHLKGLDGTMRKNHEALLNCLEAGENSYFERGRGYEVLKN